MYYLYNTEFERVGVIEEYQSVIWTTRFYTSGDFEICLPATERNLEMFKHDYYVIRDDDYTHAMIIEKIEIITDIENGNYIIVSGGDLKSIIYRRIIWGLLILNNTVTNCIYSMIKRNVGTQAGAARSIPNFNVDESLIISEKIYLSYSCDNLGESLEKILKKYKIGYDVTLDIDSKQFTFRLLRGSDRSYNQTQNPYVVFSNDFENLLTSNYKNDHSTLINSVLVGGENLTGYVRRAGEYSTVDALYRRESYVDGSEIQSGILSADAEDYAAYVIALSDRAAQEVAKHLNTESVEGEIESNYNFVFNRDYFLGDIVEVENEYGHRYQPRIIEAIESEDENGKTTILTYETDEEIEEV